MHLYNAFNLIRIDIKATDDKHVFFSIEKFNIAFCIDSTDIACLQIPIFGKELTVIKIVITFDNVHPFNTNLTFLAHAQYIFLIIKYLDIDAWNRHANRTGELSIS